MIQPITVPVDIKKANLDGLGIRRAIFGKPAVIPFRPIVVARRLFGLQPSMGIRTAGDLRAAVTWKNTGGQNYAFDILVLYGIYDAAASNFSIYWEGIVQNVTSSPGDQKTTNVDTTVPNVPAGMYDVLVSVCDAIQQDSIWVYDVVYAQMLYEDVIEIVGPAVTAELIGTVFSTI